MFKLKDISPITFASADYDEISIEVVSMVEKLLGRTLARADPLRIFLRGVELLLSQQRLLIDQTAKQNLLAFAEGEYLDRLGDLVGAERLQATSAWTTLELRLSTQRQTSTVIRAGTRVTADNQIYFATDEAVIFAAGETVKTVRATCTVTGEIGNGFAPGELSNIVDPQPWLQSMTNVTTSAGGSDTESDDDLRERIHEMPESFSVAGSEGAYKIHAKSVSALISDVGVDSPEPGKVDVYILMKGGKLPDDEILQAVYEHLNAKTVRPLTDFVKIKKPEVINYELIGRYFVSREDAIRAAAIEQACQNAVSEFVEWQRSKLGLDINPSKLVQLLLNAGVKRVEIYSPKFQVVDEFSVAIPSSVSVVFAGLEDD